MRRSEQGMTLGQDRDSAEDTMFQYLTTLSDNDHPHSFASTRPTVSRPRESA